MRIILPPVFFIGAIFSKVGFVRWLLSLRFLEVWLLLGVPRAWKWGHHVEEYINLDPLLRLNGDRFVYEDGCEPKEIFYTDVTGIIVRRWDGISHGKWSWLWRPPYWVEIQFLDEFVEDGETEADYACIELCRAR